MYILDETGAYFVEKIEVEKGSNDKGETVFRVVASAAGKRRYLYSPMYSTEAYAFNALKSIMIHAKNSFVNWKNDEWVRDTDGYCYH